jgi:hypothetical protein
MATIEERHSTEEQATTRIRLGEPFHALGSWRNLSESYSSGNFTDTFDLENIIFEGIEGVRKGKIRVDYISPNNPEFITEITLEDLDKDTVNKIKTKQIKFNYIETSTQLNFKFRGKEYPSGKTDLIYTCSLKQEHYQQDAVLKKMELIGDVNFIIRDTRKEFRSIN